MKVGDLVRFLNDVGGGRISRIDAGKKLVYVEDADGFEIPVLAQEVVIVDQEQPRTPQEKSAAQMGARPYSTHAAAITPEPATSRKRPDPEPVVETPEGDELRVMLAFLPADIRQLQTTPTELILVNDSNYYLYYNISVEADSHARCMAHGLIEPNMQESLLTIMKDELNDWEHVRAQVIPFKQQKEYAPQHAIDLGLHINPVKFYKLHAYQPTEYFDEPALLLDLVAESRSDRLRDLSAETIRDAMMQKRPEPDKPRSKPAAKRQENLIEVDLHIGQLLDTTAGMSPADMLAYQMETFHRNMRQNLRHKGQKIIFIHGKGEGVLRHEIEKALRTRYKQCSYQDASFREYGFGATQVTIR